MGRTEHHLSEEEASTSTSGFVTEGTKDVHPDWTDRHDTEETEEHPDRSDDGYSSAPVVEPRSSSPRPSEPGYEAGKFCFVLVRRQSHLSLHQVKVVPGWIQKVVNEEVTVFTRYGFGRVSKSAIMPARSSNVSQDHLDQLKAARTTGWNLEQLPLMVEEFERDLMEDRHDCSPSLRVPSGPKLRTSQPYRGQTLTYDRRKQPQPQPQSQHGWENNSSNSQYFKGGMLCQSYPGAPEMLQPNVMQGYSTMPSVQTSYSRDAVHNPAGIPTYTIVVCHYPGQSPTYYVQPCVPYNYYFSGSSM